MVHERVLGASARPTIGHLDPAFSDLMEEIKMEKGKVMNPSLLDYKILSSADMPEVDSLVVETDDPHGPFGAKEAGEGLTIPTAPAVANAIYDAIGVRIKDLPITPDKILRALEEKEGK